jgi:hypothetical protein
LRSPEIRFYVRRGAFVPIDDSMTRSANFFCQFRRPTFRHLLLIRGFNEVTLGKMRSFRPIAQEDSKSPFAPIATPDKDASGVAPYGCVPTVAKTGRRPNSPEIVRKAWHSN